VSTPLHWDEVPDCVPEAYTIDTVPARFTSLGDPGACIDDVPGSLDELLAWAKRDKEAGLDTPPPPRPGGSEPGTGRRQSTMPLIEIARSASLDEAMAGLDRWKQRHPDVWPRLHVADVLVDSMRGRSSTWTRIRLNLQHVPEDERPPQEPLEVEYDPWQGLDPGQFAGRSEPSARADRQVRDDGEEEQDPGGP
jgi:hypothetical protein